MKNKKLKAILSITGYFLLVIALCFSASLIFHNIYYEMVYVSGSSMYPTLNGEDEDDGSIVDFGIADYHKTAINNIKRFSIVSTYYYDDYGANEKVLANAKVKIKRIIAMPNETFKIENGKLYVLENEEYKYIPNTFQTEPSEYTGKDVESRTLGPDEYWVLGDHRDKSRDSGSINAPVKKSYILGVLVAIEGRAELKISNYYCQSCNKSYKTATGTICPDCYGPLIKNYKLVNKQYHWPTYF